LSSHQHIDQTPPLLPGKLSKFSCARDVRQIRQNIGQAVREVSPEHAGYRTGAFRPKRGFPSSIVQRRPLHCQFCGRTSFEPRPADDVRDV
jgi:hypothetical protein